MESTLLLCVVSILVLVYVFFNVYLSKEAYQWEPALHKRIILVLCIWLILFFGGMIAYKYLGLEWFKQKNSKTGGSQLGGVLLEIDAIFNPEKKYLIEAKLKQEKRIEQEEDGEMYKQNKPDINKLKK